ncbi:MULTISPECIES: 16S rRNA (uracil(1498)-N(3))-methyltransferase [Ralstonia]|jgi:16S rRNA (uracil1498-N3)-methyltransferase|uniref:Ribosomal RNA small subunit methyltransferase E n=1 Tax=Ralstonia pickettii OR214 TaxID=1264675 RepID=R0CHV5_RALPI|nr:MULTISPECIES: 16S rRNA (uracil(1498)-N(3))-methyltransferase [Ralstonia]MEA3270644.1 16S rRNA (uracil(1498)-N(3))-methyltransferase [Pseudomonadota bacterium]ENZ76411.1 RNA methyltransferase, RsmE family [Ralstonia pickettii OR214]MCM3578981.1 16S rRNA (uracil(1498)-N(3))-methyltransferase [Ralstonia pickettii]MDR9384562.1 16S rRNA (uracil(1498)-N(3))-methyltransferase [Ralstonia sp. 11b]OYU24260.1 MAG: 16S rRNA (uracil(1498)-N(3))-methyltransferase [Ralstonia sp. PBBBR1]
MGLPRFFVDTPLAPNTTVTLDESVTRHIHVLRLAAGDDICLFDGSGYEFRARLDAINKRDATASLVDATQPDTEARYAITLAQGIAGGDKMDWLIEKAVELGVNAVAPLQTERGVVRLSGERAVKRVQHWQALVQAACEQCGRARVPVVAPVATLREWLATAKSTDAPRVLLSPRGAQSLTQWAVQSRTRIVGSGIVLLIGPEGGLSPDEEALAESAGFLPLTLGRRILRTESAALVAVSALHAVLGEF